MVLQVVKRKYQQEYDIAPPITFASDHVALDIPDDGTHTDNGWEIVPLHMADVSSRMYKVLELTACMCWCMQMFEVSFVVAEAMSSQINV